MKISIITVCFNSEKTIAKTIESVFIQSNHEIEYIIIDGNSTDNTLKIIREYERKKPDNIDMVVISEKDRGIYDAMNKGISLATGELVGIINSDDWYEKDAFTHLLEYYDVSRSKFQVLYGPIVTWKAEKKRSILWFSAEFLDEQMICHPGAFVTLDTYKKYGVFDLNYKIVADYDLMMRLYRKEDVVFVPIEDIIANFMVGGASDSVACKEDIIKLKYKYGAIRKREYMLKRIAYKIEKIIK